MSNDITSALQSHAVVAALSDSILFGGLSQGQLGLLSQLGTVVSYRTNQTIFSEGDDGNALFVVVSGAVRISRIVPGMGEEALAVVRAGAVFGEMALVEAAPRSANALAHETCELLVIDKQDLLQQMDRDPLFANDILWKLVRTLSGRLREMNDKLTMLSLCAKF